MHDIRWATNKMFASNMMRRWMDGLMYSPNSICSNFRLSRANRMSLSKRNSLNTFTSFTDRMLPAIWVDPSRAKGINQSLGKVDKKSMMNQVCRYRRAIFL
mmetsp:Transcript_29972/g.39406  ORF Transcript_29972/g.39406 Transcript_29972/m.39406 type:complete len:101 (-) Transcript_29972:67-369(-)